MSRAQTPIADQLREAIADAERRGVSRYRLAQVTGIRQQTLSKIVHGTTPRVDMAEKIAAGLGCCLMMKKVD